MKELHYANLYNILPEPNTSLASAYLGEQVICHSLYMIIWSPEEQMQLLRLSRSHPLIGLSVSLAKYHRQHS